MRKNRADAVHIMYSCAAFANNGLVVELVAPYVKRNDYDVKENSIFDLYDVPNNFKITELNTKIRERNNKSSAIIVGINRIVFTVIYIFQNLRILKKRSVVIYSKCYTSTIPYILAKRLGLIRCRLVFETPFLSDNAYHKFIMKRMDAIVVMTSYVQEFLKNTFKINEIKVIKCPVRFQTDYHSYDQSGKEKFRKQLNWDPKLRYVVYAGKTGVNLKRIQVFAEASTKLINVKFVIVGATQGLTQEFSDKHYENLILYPFQSYPDYLKFVNAADILIATYENTLYNRHTLSPGKGGAYLQSGNPVVFTDLPCLRERFPNDLVSFVKPDDIENLANVIDNIMDNYQNYSLKAADAANFVKHKTFTNAASFILNKLNNTLFH